MTKQHREREVGLPHLAGTFHRYWREEVGSDIDVLMAYANGVPTCFVEAALVDALRLADSAVPAWAIEALWSLGTEEQHVLRDEGREARDWLRLLIELYQEHLRTRTPGSPTSAPSNPYLHLTGTVLDQIRLVTNPVLEQSLGLCRRYVPGVMPALEQVAIWACPDLAFRFLLDALRVLGPGISRSQYELFVYLGRDFEYGEDLVGNYDHLIAD